MPPTPLICSIKPLNPLNHYQLNLQHPQHGRRETNDRRRKKGGKRKEARDRRRETGGERQEAGDKMQETRDRKLEMEDRREDGETLIKFFLDAMSA